MVEVVHFRYRKEITLLEDHELLTVRPNYLASDWILFKEEYVKKKDLRNYVDFWLSLTETFKVYNRLVVDIMCEWKEVDNQRLRLVKVYVKVADKDFVVPKHLRRKIMNKKETLKQKIAEAQEALEQAQKELEKLESNNAAWYKRWEPKKKELYYFIDSDGDISNTYFDKSLSAYDRGRFDIFNCFRTKEEAELEAKRLLLWNRMKDLALRCDGKEIDWEDDQMKFAIIIEWDTCPNEDEDDPDYDPLSLDFEPARRYEEFGHIYCYDDRTFMKAAREELLGDFREYFELKEEIERENDVNRRTNKEKNK